MTAEAVRVKGGLASCLAAGLAWLMLFCLGTTARSGEEVASPEEDGRKWTLPGPIPKPPEQAGASRLGQSMEVVGEFVAIDERSTVYRSDSDGRMVPRRLQVGDKLRVGDEIRVGPEAETEVTLGLNARLRIGENSVVRVLDKREYPTGRDEGKVTKRDMELAHGSARVRVRRNELQPSPVLMISGDVELSLDRSDTMIERQSADKRSTVVVLNGKAEVRLKTRDEVGLGQTSSRTVTGGQKLQVPDGVLKSIPSPMELTTEDMKQAHGDMAFTVERQQRQRPPPPAYNEELDGP